MTGEAYKQYLGQLQRRGTAESGDLKQSLFSAAEASPDDHAATLRLANDVGLPPDLIPEDRSTLQKQARLSAVDPDQLLRTSPTTARWMTTPQNAGVAQDDLDTLTGIEQVVKPYRSGARIGGIDPLSRVGLQRGEVVRESDLPAIEAELRKSMPFMDDYELAQYARQHYAAGVVSDDTPLIGRIEGPRASLKSIAEGVRTAVVEGSRRGGLGIQQQVGDLFGLDISGLQRDYARSQFEQDITTPQLDTRTGRALYGGAVSIGQNAPGLALSVLTGNPMPALAGAGLQVQGEAYGKYRGRGASPLAAFAGASGEGAVEVLTEMVPMNTFFRAMALDTVGTKAAKEFLRSQLQDQVGEQAATFLQDAIDTAVANPDKTWGDFLKERPDAAYQTAVATLMQSAVMGGLLHVPQARAQALRAQQNADFMSSLGEAATASKMRARAPDKFHEFLRNQVEGSDVENVMVPVQQWETYFQSKALSPEEIAQAMGISTRDYQEAVATGSELVIPLEQYVDKIAATEHHEALLPDLRLRPGDTTLREAATLEDTERRDVGRLTKGLVDESQADAGQVVYDDVLGQLLGLNMDRGTAGRYAQLMAARFTTMADRWNAENPNAPTTVAELYGHYGLGIVSPAPAAARGNVDHLDVLLDRLRGGEVPSEQEALGPNLLDFLREGGVQDAGGELGALDLARATFVPGRRSIIRPDGMTLDEAVMRAQEAGYFPQDDMLTGSDLVDSVSEALRGHHRYAPGNENADLMNQRMALQDLERYLGDIGVDIADTDNATIKALLTKNGADVEDTVLSQGESGGDFEATARAYGGRAGWMAARDAGTTTLPYGQWVQVRTPAFKQEFGDWEALRAQTRLDAMAPVAVSVPEEWAGLSVDELRAQVKSALDAVIASGQPLEHPEIGDVNVTRRGVKKALSASADPAKLLVLGDVRRAFESSIFASANPASGQSDVIAYEKLLARLNVAGTEVVAIFAVQRMADGRQFYNTVTLDDGQEKAPVASPRAASSGEGDTTSAYTGASDFVRQRLARVNPESVTVPLDPTTGEPLPESIPQAQQLFQRSGEDRRATSAGGRRLTDAQVWEADPATMTPEEQIALIERLRYEAQTSPLTGLGNKVAWQRVAKKAHIAALDADSLKWVNDNLGHEAGDQMLGLIGNALRDAGLEAYHVSGDEYWAQADDAAALREGLDKARAAITKAVVGNDKWSLKGLSFSYGIANNEAAAEEGMHHEKESREKAGLRPARGSTPAGAHRRGEPGFVDTGAARAGDTGAAQGSPAGAPAGESPLNQQLFQGADDARGYVTFGKDRKFTIALLKNRDLSTFLHESGHFYLETLRDMAASTQAEQSQLRNDWQTIQEWLGIKDLEAGQAIPVEAHETFARGFEAYLREGKAPSEPLRDAFARFRTWLLQIYRNVRQLRVDVSPEVSAVMDRLLATDIEIQAAEQQRGYVQLFATAEDAGMTEAQFEAYRHAAERAHEQARDRLARDLFREMKREQQASYKADLEATRESVTAEANSQPVYQAREFLSMGRLLTGELPEGLEPVKLNKAALVQMYGREFLKRLPRPYIYAREGGVHPDVIAPVFGFPSGDEMVRAIINAPERKALIAAEVDRQMKERHGDMMTDGSLADAAMQAVHNEHHGKLLRAELEGLARKRRELQPLLNAAQRDDAKARKAAFDIPPAETFQEAARQAIAQKRVQDIRPHLYLYAERAMSRSAFELIGKKDYKAAAEAKQRELLNHYMYQEAQKALQAAEATYRDMKVYSSMKVRQTVGLAGGDFLEQLNAVLADFEFRRRTKAELDEPPVDVLVWAQRKLSDEGLVLAVPERMPRPVNYQQLTVEDLAAVHELVASIVRVASKASRVIINGKKENLEEVAELAAAQMRDHRAQRPDSKDQTANALAAFQNATDWTTAALIRPEMLLEFTGAKPLLDLMTTAQNKLAEKNLRLSGFAQRLNDIFSIYGNKARLGRLGELHQRRVIDELNGETRTKAQLLMMALNWGSQDNRTKLAEGYGYSEASIQNALDKYLTKEDWDAVQAVWDEMESLWPEIADLERRTVGLVPAKVEAKGVVTPHGIYRGGYFPIVYDTKRKGTDRLFGAQQMDTQQSAIGYARRATKAGHTEERTVSAGMPIKLDPSVISRHFDAVLHDLYMRETVQDMHRVFSHSSVREAMEDTMGVQAYRVIRPWINRIANDTDQTGGAIAELLRFGRTAVTAGGLGFNVLNAIQNFASIPSIREYTGGAQLAAAMVDLATTPRQVAKQMLEKSVFMRARGDTYNVDIRDATRRVDTLGITTPIGKYMHWLQGKTQFLVDTVAWHAAYQQALAGNADQRPANDEAEAVAYADHVVRQAMGGGQAIDIADVQSHGELSKALTMFFGYFNTQGNLMLRRGQLTGQQLSEGEYGKAVVGAASTVLLTWFLQQMLAEIVMDPPEDDEDWKKIAHKVGAFPAQFFPMVRDIANFMQNPQYGYSLSPVAGAFESMGRAAVAGSKAAQGDELKRGDWNAIIDTLGAPWALPTRQMRKSGEALIGWVTGDDLPEDPLDAFYDFTKGPNRK